jgi:carboxyl-terminal processing protease
VQGQAGQAGRASSARVAELSEKGQGLGVIHRGEPNGPEAAETDERGVVETACALIDQGKFDAAGQLIEASGYERRGWKSVAQLKDIVGQWERLQKERAEQREAAYKEQLAGFERVKKGLPVDVNDLNDVNESKGPTAILAAVIRTIEFADENQKKGLLSDPCVVDSISSAKAEAAKLESEGKWFDAYVKYYSWLAALEPNNKSYKDYSERLIEKAEIWGSFQDSPCETGKQRFEGVKRRIFERAVEALNFNYVNKIDYREMATKGIRRSRLLAEVVGTLTKADEREMTNVQYPISNKEVKSKEEKGKKKEEDRKGKEEEPNAALLGESFRGYAADANAIAKFISQLSALEKETSEWPEGAGRDGFVAAFGKVLELNLTSARLPEEVVIAQFAEASLSALDPYTVIVWPTSVSEFEKAMTNEFSGIGIEISRQKGQLTVSSLVPDTPAYNSGLDAGDVIENVNGVTTKDMPIGCAVKSITGPAGTKVTLTIRREGEQQGRDITITRAKIVVPTIRGWQRNGEGRWQYVVDEQDKIGYVRMTGFSEKTAPDLEDALKTLEASDIRGLILDLRFNSGGYFDSAVEVADDFLDEGLIVITRPRFGIPAYEAAHKKGTHPNYPMVVLVNSGSASASEIVAGALSDPSQRRATLVGERTHGKGMVQGITHFPGEGAQLKYTMAYYHLPSGQRVKSREEAEKGNTQDWGVGPDVAVELRSDELRRMFDVQRDNEVLFKAGHNADAGPLKRHSLGQTIEADQQLATAILVIKSKLIREQVRTAKLQIPLLKS